METYTGTEKRRFRRLEEKFKVDYLPVDATEERPSETTITKDISAGGVRIYCHRTYPTGSILSLIIKLPSEGVIKARAKVIWSSKINGKYTIGMEYIEIEGADTVILYAQKAFEKKREEMEKGNVEKGKEDVSVKAAGEPEEDGKKKPELKTSDINILVVDDEKVMLDLFRKILGIKGYNAICAQDGFEAMEVIKDKRIDLAFIDIKLPGGMNGVGTFRMLKREKPDVKVVMITGFLVEKEISEAMKNGAIAALKKPFDNIQEIYNIIEKNVKK